MADHLAELRAFRRRLHATFDRRKDALFELNDAVLAAGTVPVPVHLSLQPVHRRAWTSLYSALRYGRIDEEAARDSQDPGYGAVRVRAWSGLHPKTRRAGQRYGSGTAAVVKGTVILVEVERLLRDERRRKPKKLWLWWHGSGEPDLGLLWKSYVRRFDIEHGVKLLKSALGWTTPRVRHPGQADRWTWLVLAAYAQLRLARGVISDQRLP